MTHHIKALLILPFLLALLSCSSPQKVHQVQYAKLKTTKTFEHDFPVVWKAIEGSVKGYRVTERDPDEVTTVELKRLRERSLETDWIYTRSKTKFISFKVNGFPRKKYVQSRVRYMVEAKKVMGGIEVSIGMKEEIENLDQQGESLGFDSVKDIDTAQANRLLRRIENAILSRNNV